MPGDEFPGKLVGLPGRGAVADGDQLDRVLLGEPGQFGDRLVPPVGRDVRVDHVRGDDLAGRVDHGHLHAGPEAGVEAERRPRARGGGQQQVAQVRREHPDGLVLGGRAQPQPQIDAEVDEDAGAPGPADRVRQPLVAGAAPVGDAEAGGRRSPRTTTGRRPGLLLRFQDEVEDLLLLAAPAQHRQDAVRRAARRRARRSRSSRSNFAPASSLPSRTLATSRPRTPRPPAARRPRPCSSPNRRARSRTDTGNLA
ncbi:hypothetical protein SGLAM104S_06434 [Streptomyces glaucescens]